MKSYKDPQNQRSPWYTKQEAVKRLGWSVSSFDRERRKKGTRLRTFVIRGTNCLRFHEDDLDRLIHD